MILESSTTKIVFLSYTSPVGIFAGKGAVAGATGAAGVSGIIGATAGAGAAGVASATGATGIFWKDGTVPG